MHVVSVKTLREFWEGHADSEAALKAWYREAKGANWTCFADIKARYRSADHLPGDRAVFDIKGNKYRLVVRAHYNASRIFIRFIGTHAEYDKIKAETI
jgi:mRNA interferase HigB